MTDMAIDRQIEYWKAGSDDDWESSGRLCQTGPDYHWALFIMHLSLEKALKALVTKKIGALPPKTHNLIRLAELGGLELTEDQVFHLEQANQFCLACRYPEEQSEIRILATRDYANETRLKLGRIREWVLSRI